MHTNAQSVLNNLVLLNTICDHSDNAELLCMMRTSRLGFNTAASRVWRDLNRVEPLLLLLAPTFELLPVDEDESIMEMTLPAFGPKVFTRFNCYNTFVRKLDASNTWYLDKSGSTLLEIKSWSTLSLQLQHAPLFPNLSDLKFSGCFSDESEAVLWISTFISHSVETLDLHIFAPALGSLGTAAVFGLLTQKASGLKNLSHNLTIVANRDDHAATSQLVLSPFACGHLRNSQHLAHLATGGQFIDPTILLELSRLPKLQSLSISQISSHNRNFTRILKDIQLPMESFPSLQTLKLDSTVLDDIVAAWNVIPLVSGLTTVTLSYISDPPGAKTIYDEDVLLSILPLIATSSPDIKELTLDNMVFERSELLSTNLTSSPWIHMGHLSLSYLKLKEFRVDAASLRDVKRIWSHLVTLEIPQQELTPQHLVYLSQLPELKKITAATFKDMDSVVEVQSRGNSPLQLIEIIWVFRQVKIKSVERVARFLLGLWPRLQQIFYVHKFKKTPQPDLEFLNMYIRMVQGVAKTKEKITTRHGPDAVRLLLDESLMSLK
ncbi:hypothetical protein FRC12_005209 [Ceratobasidium sp. 428]|nr:hypothetical protein FRC12_005209 [Ceratobasidium sp. 428]